jgi:uncharacterized protein (DUF2249 family)
MPYRPNLRWSKEGLCAKGYKGAYSKLGGTTMTQEQKRVVDVRQTPPAQRHPMIFDTFASLQPGESFELVNDHDPKPLYYQFQAELAGQSDWKYLEQGPHVWRVQIGRL